MTTKEHYYKTYFYQYANELDDMVRHNKRMHEDDIHNVLNQLSLLESEYMKALKRIEYLESVLEEK